MVVKMEESIINESEMVIKRIIDDIKNSNISHGNYKEFVDRVDKQCDMIESNINNLMSRYKEKEIKLNEELERKTVKDMLEDEGVITDKAYELTYDMLELLKDVNTQRAIKGVMLISIYEKLTAIVGTFKAYDVEKEVIGRMKELQESFLNLTKEILSTRIESLENKMQSYEKGVTLRIDNHMSDVNTRLMRFSRSEPSIEIHREISRPNPVKDPVKAIDEIMSESEESIDVSEDIIDEEVEEKSDDKTTEGGKIRLPKNRNKNDPIKCPICESDGNNNKEIFKYTAGLTKHIVEKHKMDVEWDENLKEAEW